MSIGKNGGLQLELLEVGVVGYRQNPVPHALKYRLGCVFDVVDMTVHKVFCRRLLHQPHVVYVMDFLLPTVAEFAGERNDVFGEDQTVQLVRKPGKGVTPLEDVLRFQVPFRMQLYPFP